MVNIEKISKNYYILETDGHICKGMIEKINNKATKVRLDVWYDKHTKRYKSPSNKLFNHTTKWFLYMWEKYYKMEV